MVTDSTNMRTLIKRQYESSIRWSTTQAAYHLGRNGNVSRRWSGVALTVDGWHVPCTLGSCIQGGCAYGCWGCLLATYALEISRIQYPRHLHARFGVRTKRDPIPCHQIADAERKVRDGAALVHPQAHIDPIAVNAGQLAHIDWVRIVRPLRRHDSVAL